MGDAGETTGAPSDKATPTRVPIGTKLPKSGKKIKGAPRGKRASINSAVSVATGGASGASWNVDERAVVEAKKVAEQLLGHLRSLARSHPDFCAPGVGEGDPSGAVWPFLCGAGRARRVYYSLSRTQIASRRVKTVGARFNSPAAAPRAWEATTRTTRFFVREINRTRPSSSWN